MTDNGTTMRNVPQTDLWTAASTTRVTAFLVIECLSSLAISGSSKGATVRYHRLIEHPLGQKTKID